jgi:hypothetical protein
VPPQLRRYQVAKGIGYGLQSGRYSICSTDPAQRPICLWRQQRTKHNADTDPCPDTDTDTDADANPDTDANPDPDTDANPDPDTNPDANPNPDTDTNPNPDTAATKR